MIEAEAKTKWCPHARVMARFTDSRQDRTDSATANRDYYNDMVPKKLLMPWFRLHGVAGDGQ